MYIHFTVIFVFVTVVFVNLVSGGEMCGYEEARTTRYCVSAVGLRSPVGL